MNFFAMFAFLALFFLILFICGFFCILHPSLEFQSPKYAEITKTTAFFMWCFVLFGAATALCWG